MSKKMGVFIPSFLIILLALVLYRLDDITDVASGLIDATPKVVISKANEYSLNNDYSFVQKSRDFIPYSRQDLINIFYSILDNGYENFTFYCPSEYVECIDDMTNIISNKTLITDIGNFVHPFNNFQFVELTTSSSGEINIKITKTYEETEIEAVNRKVDEIMANIFTDDMTNTDKILKAHDYLIDNTYYDTDENNDDLNAYNLFFEGKSKCFGYADAMSIILNKLGIKNYKVGSASHVWNALYLDGTWQQIDVTWDDPIVEDGSRITSTIRHKFYMIDTETILSYDTEEHGFDFNIYSELKNNS